MVSRMSGSGPDFYLTLHQRLQEVKQWVELDPEVMRRAMDEQSLSFERAARLVPCSEKTLRRYMQRGAVPREMLEPVARALGLEIEHTGPSGTLTVEADWLLDWREKTDRRFDEFERELAGIALKLDALIAADRDRASSLP